MLTGDIRNQIDTIWNVFWTGGISNPLEVIEQITYLLFIKRLDDLHTLEENKATRLRKPIERRVFPAGKDDKKRPYDDFRWSRFKHFAPAEMYTVVSDHVFPFLRTWYSPRKVDTKLTVGLVVRPFKFVRGDIPQGGMTADAVVEHFQ
ncbi:MAG: Type restriction-modification system, DNA-methyltransferase subunit, partial [Gemmataceae bacterium]|nr:Type restriction-modification system, DNA-methyltransferase subunit [Gemmataceae bacterium]